MPVQSINHNNAQLCTHLCSGGLTCTQHFLCHLNLAKHQRLHRKWPVKNTNKFIHSFIKIQIMIDHHYIRFIFFSHFKFKSSDSDNSHSLLSTYTPLHSFIQQKTTTVLVLRLLLAHSALPHLNSSTVLIEEEQKANVGGKQKVICASVETPWQ
jgi:hypothetical protein